MLFCVSQDLAIMSGAALGDEIAMMAPFMSCGPLNSARANTLCTTACQ